MRSAARGLLAVGMLGRDVDDLPAAQPELHWLAAAT
jgi:hypothetical protein